MTAENTRALLKAAQAHLDQAADSAPVSARQAILAGKVEDARLSLFAKMLHELRALSVPDTNNREVREKLFDLIRECDCAEEIVDKLLAAFPVLSRDIAGEIEAVADDELRESAHDEFYVRGLRRAAEIVRRGR